MQVREILKVSLGIARDVPILRVKRAHTGEFYIQLTILHDSSSSSPSLGNVSSSSYLLLSYTVVCDNTFDQGANNNNTLCAFLQQYF